MVEIEVPIEKVQEDIHHQAHHSHHDDEDSTLVSRGALLSAFLAVFAAISALMAGHYANEAMIEQLQSSDQWAYYQAKGIKKSISELKAQIIKDEEAIGKGADEYKAEQEEIKHKAEEKEHEAKEHLRRHESLAMSVTFFQVAIAMTAISVLTRKRSFLLFATGLGFVGVVWVLKTFLI